MHSAAPRLALLAVALALGACSQAEPPVPEFQTVVVDLREPSAQVASVPLPERKPTAVANVSDRWHDGSVATASISPPQDSGMVSPTPIGPDGRPVVPAQAIAATHAVASAQTTPEPETVAAANTGSSPQYASVTRYFKRWLPDFNKITDCPNGITCQAAFAN